MAGVVGLDRDRLPDNRDLVALNLQGGEYLVNFDLPFNPAVLRQRIGRLRRLGQERSCVRVINFVARDTIEEKVLKILKSKELLSKNFLDKDILSGMSTKDIGTIL